MSRHHSHLNTAVAVIKEYTGEEPCLSGRQALANYLKKFFSSNKKYGSKDRKSISHLCYCYYRAAPPPPEGGSEEPGISVEERIITGLFLCSIEPNELLENLRPEWNGKVGLSLQEKCSLAAEALAKEAMLNVQCSMNNMFPFANELSDGLDAAAFAKSFLIQPDLFLRIRPGNKEKVLDKLNNAGLKFDLIGADCIALPNNSKVESILELNKEAVVQDYSSQRVGEMLLLSTANRQYIRQSFNAGGLSTQKIWDCCAASGGKSILAKDILGDIDLTVSDIRESILANLKKRFAEAGIKNYHSFIADLASVNCPLPTVNFNLIIADVPCTGSGTWSRTPEQLHFFNHQIYPTKLQHSWTIEQYSHLQKKIVSNVVNKLNPGGHLLYITCSVFKKENEDVVEFIQKLHLTLIKKEILIGYDKKADTMFTALLQKPVTAL